jgi:hypothetical protein
MRKLLSNLGAVFVAAASFALTAALILLVDSLSGVNLFGLMWWGIVPIGALVTGLLAASGSYFGALKLNVKPSGLTAGVMLIAAASVQVALYYARYVRATTEDGQPIAELVSFSRFVGWMLEQTKYSVIVYGYRPGGADGGLGVGAFGYVLAGLQFLALIAGAAIVYVILADKPYCDRCAKFLRPVSKLELWLRGGAEVLSELRKEEPLSDGYFRALRTRPAGRDAALVIQLSTCPGCAREALVEKLAFAKDGKLSYDAGSFRTSWTPPNVSVRGQVENLFSPDTTTRVF